MVSGESPLTTLKLIPIIFYIELESIHRSTIDNSLKKWQLLLEI